MISFIVIGRNEEKNLERCIRGIYSTISYNKISRYEIIYVDSRSTDLSIQVVQEFPEVRIFLVTGECNAAIGRNIGAKEATGSVLFFIDADMELNPPFLEGVYDEKTASLKDGFVSGYLHDIIDGEVIKRSSNTLVPGGIFLVNKDMWMAAGGMRNKFRAGEDYDFGLRMIEKGYRFTRKKEIITNHYTVPNMDKSRIWKSVWNKYAFFPRCVLIRNHLFTPQAYRLLWKNDKTFVVLIIALLGTLIYFPAAPVLLAAYFIAVTLRSVENRKYLPLGEMIIYYLLTDLLNFIYFFTFFPKEKEEKYVAVSARVTRGINTEAAK